MSTPKTLNFSPLNADTRGDSVSSNLPLTPAKSHECPTSQTHRHQHLRRPVCRKAQDAAREGRAVRGRTGREIGCVANYVVRMGINGAVSDQRRPSSDSRSIGRRSPNSDAQKIIFQENSQKWIFSLDKSTLADYIVFRDAESTRKHKSETFHGSRYSLLQRHN